MSRRIKSFTLLELVVTMILTAIGTSLVNTAYVYISKTYAGYVDSRQRLIELSEFYAVFQEELDKAEEAVAGQNRVNLVFDRKHSFYYFNDSTVVREQGVRIDTFNIGLKRYKFYYENKSGKLAEVELTAMYKDEEILFYFDRQSDVQSLFLNQKN